MFDKIHQKEFDKMDSITSHYAAKRGTQSTVSQPISSKKRKSSLVVKERPSGVPVARHRPSRSRVASGASMKTLLGGFTEEGMKMTRSQIGVYRRGHVLSERNRMLPHSQTESQ